MVRLDRNGVDSDGCGGGGGADGRLLNAERGWRGERSNLDQSAVNG